PCWKSAGETAIGLHHHQMLEPVLRRPALRHRLVGIFIAKLVQPEPDALEKAQALGHCLRAVAAQPAHFGRGLEVPFNIGGEQPPGFADRYSLADAGDDVLEWPVARRGVKGLIGGKKRYPDPVRQSLEPGQPPAVAARPWHRRSEPDRAGAGLRKPAQEIF